MTFGEHVFLYCERGTDAALWAEPVNAISNAGFFLAALVGWQLLLWRPPEERSPDHFLLVGLTFLIGCGSLAFHVYADQGTELADIVPIGLFMMVYLGFALNRFLAVPPGWTVLIVIGFAAVVAASMQVQCWGGGVGLPGVGVTDAKPCLNGSVAYLPALGALIILAMVLTERHHRAAPYVVWATIIFIGSIMLRSIDMSFCDRVVIDGRDVGTHFIWHILNAVVIFLLLLASFRAGPVPGSAPKKIFAKTRPVETASVEIVRGKAEPAKDDSAREDSAKEDSAKTDSAEKDSAKEEPKKEEPKPSKTESPKEDPKEEQSKPKTADEKPSAKKDAPKDKAKPEPKPGDDGPSDGKEDEPDAEASESESSEPDESEPDKPEEAEPKMP